MASPKDGMKCIKYMLFSTSFIFVLLAILLISTGSSILVIYKNFDVFLELHHFRPSEILIAVGAIILIVSILGCVGAVQESTMLVNAYALLLFLIIILEMSSGIAAFALRSTISDDIEDNMVYSLNNYTQQVEAKDSWDFAQKNLGCCGVQRPNDWTLQHLPGHLVIIDGHVFAVPYSCCINYPSFCYDIHRQGCLSSLERYLSDSSLAIGFTAVTVTVIQFFGAIIALMLAKGIRSVKTKQEMERQENESKLFKILAGESKGVVTSVMQFPEITSTDA